MRKIFSAVVIFLGLFSFAAPALAGDTYVGLVFNDKSPFIYSISPEVGEQITPRGVLSYQATWISTLEPIPNATVTLWDVTKGAPIANATTNSEGEYAVVLKIGDECNDQFTLEARFAGFAAYPAATSGQRQVTPQGVADPCVDLELPYTVISAATPPSKKLPSSTTYTPLVEIPGVGTPKNLSQYLVGLYNFLLSIVGIAAVLMMVIGGFKYLTAAANPSAASEAKDIISNAAFGLLLAILTWVIVSTINPDLLVIKQPGTGLSGSYNPFCTTSAADATDCVCVGGVTVSRGTTPTCNEACAGNCAREAISCVEPGTNSYTDATNQQCSCMDGTKIPAPAGQNCNEICLNNCGWKFLAVKLDIALIGACDPSTFSELNDYCKLDSDNAQLWELFLTNDGKYDDNYFDVEAQSYTSGWVTYDCAILITEEDTGVIDDRQVIWVKKGAIIDSDLSSISLKTSIEKSVGGPGTGYVYDCPGGESGPEACDLSFGIGKYQANNTGDTFQIFAAKYNNALDYCRSCDLAKLDDDQKPMYFPNKALICDPYSKVWRYY